jgi:hypothetical protein
MAGRDASPIEHSWQTVGLDQLRGFVKRRLEAAQDQLEREVMFGHRMDEFGYTSAGVMDRFSNNTIGYSFIDSPENGFKRCKNKLLKALMDNPVVAPFLVKRVQGGRIEWNKDGCVKWLKRTKAFLETLTLFPAE